MKHTNDTKQCIDIGEGVRRRGRRHCRHGTSNSAVGDGLVAGVPDPGRIGLFTGENGEPERWRPIYARATPEPRLRTASDAFAGGRRKRGTRRGGGLLPASWHGRLAHASCASRMHASAVRRASPAVLQGVTSSRRDGFRGGHFAGSKNVHHRVLRGRSSRRLGDRPNDRSHGNKASEPAANSRE